VIGAYDVYRGDILDSSSLGMTLPDLTRRDTIRLDMVLGGVLGESLGQSKLFTFLTGGVSLLVVGGQEWQELHEKKKAQM
jgi:hypothetical protein